MAVPPRQQGSVGRNLYLDDMPPRQPPNWIAPSSPGHNRPLVPRIERLARGLRAAAAQVETAVKLPFEGLYQPSREGLGFTIVPRTTARRSAWALVGEWLVAASIGAPSASVGLRAVHEWFWSGSGRDLGFVPDVTVAVDVTSAEELRALMPYLLDPMAAATRRDVLNAQSTPAERRVRKASGVYYTPGDVAYLLVQRAMSASGDTKRQLWLDPAHGSGVFLRAILSATYGDPEARNHIYGVDLDPMAAETSSFVLTAEDMARTPDGPAPWERWHRFRCNLATGDALLIDTSVTPVQPSLPLREDLCPLDGQPLGSFEPWRLEAVFPETAETGFARIVANPPYAPLRRSAATFHVPILHPITGSRADQDISPVFVELCTELLADDGAMAVVTPLSIVSSTRAPFPQLRQHLAEQPGALELLSFDRAPDALFGDDIKTRNAIVHLDKTAPNGLTASPLYRWTSRTRVSALAAVPVTSVDGLPGVPESIPKIGFGWERELFRACAGRSAYLEHWITDRQLLPLSRLTQSAPGESSNVIALAPTAYNFLSVVRDPYMAVTEGHDSQNSYAILNFASELHASAAYALLCSRVAFWLWHVTGDGFHVTGSVLRRLPVPVGQEAILERLADLGGLLWKAALQHPLISTNRSRTTVAYPAWTHTHLIDEIEAEVESFVGVSVARKLAEWHERLIIVDIDSKRRNLIRRKTQ